MPKIEFTVPCVPIAQPRQRQAVRTMGGKAVATNYTPAKHPVNAFKAAVQAAYQQAAGDCAPIDGPVRLTLLFVMPRPKGKIWKTKPMPRYWHTSRPDSDNLEKGVKDALNKLAWLDDSQVADTRKSKVVANGDEAAKVSIVIESLSDYEELSFYQHFPGGID